MNYSESISYIESLMPTLERPTLVRMRAFADDNENFQNKLPCFHIGGTNGKGSTAAILDSILTSAGKKVGRFTGPHIMRFNERFCVAGLPIDDRRFAEVASTVHQRSHQFAVRHADLGPLTWFEFLTAMAFFYFNEENVDVAVIEVGLGGRFDATNVIDNVLGTIITNIDLDHTQFLGDTKEKIAFEKAGIMRPGVPVITGAVEPALSVLRREARKAGTKLISIDQALDSAASGSNTIGDRDRNVATSNHEFAAIEHLSLQGPHQKRNAALAITSISHSKLHETIARTNLEALKNSLASIYFPGRMQFIHDKNLIMDGAHNPAGAAVLRRALGEGGRTFILGFFASKDVKGYLQCLLRPSDQVVAIEVGGRRTAFAKEDIVELCRDMGVDAKSANSIDEAYAISLALCNDKTPIVATGSFAVVRECMQFLGWQSVEDGRPVTETRAYIGQEMG